MKRLDKLAAEAKNIIQVEDGQTSSIPSRLQNKGFEVKCFDPSDPEAPCPVCGGLGVIKRAVEPGHPDFGKFFRCTNNPIEQDQERQFKLRKISNLEAFKFKTFQTFNVDAHPALLNAAQQALRFAENLEGWIVFEGKYGSGKTHLAAAIGNECLSNGVNVLFLTTPDLLDHLRATFSPRSEIQYDELFERVKTVELLILDDLGVENPSQWAKEKLFQLLNHRYSHKLPTVITTNININDLDPRLSSRIQDFELARQIPMVAKDYRIQFEDNYGEVVFKGDNYEMQNMNIYRDMDFESFEVESAWKDSDQNNLENAKKYARSYVDRIAPFISNHMSSKDRAERPWMVFMGGTHTGKTHLAVSIVKSLRAISKDALAHEQVKEISFVKAPQYLSFLRGTYSPESTTTSDKITHFFKSATVLVIDDLNVNHATPWAKEKLFHLIDFRYVTRQPTVFTTQAHIDTIDEWLQARFGDTRICQIVALSAESYSNRNNRYNSNKNRQ